MAALAADLRAHGRRNLEVGEPLLHEVRHDLVIRRKGGFEGKPPLLARGEGGPGEVLGELVCSQDLRGELVDVDELPALLLGLLPHLSPDALLLLEIGRETRTRRGDRPRGTGADASGFARARGLGRALGAAELRAIGKAGARQAGGGIHAPLADVERGALGAEAQARAALAQVDADALSQGHGLVKSKTHAHSPTRDVCLHLRG